MLVVVMEEEEDVGRGKRKEEVRLKGLGGRRDGREVKESETPQQ